MSRMRKKISACLIGLGFALGSSPGLAVSATGGGNGGEILRNYLNTTRELMVTLLKRIKADGIDKTEVCEKDEEKELNFKQREFCKKFAAIYIDQVLTINQNNAMSFIPGDDADIWIDRNGTITHPDAKTEHEADQPIYVNRRVNLYSPWRMLFLVLHEYGHKVDLTGMKRYVEDYQPFGPEDDPLLIGDGAILLDTIARDFADYAVDIDLIGTIFTMIDQFSCTMNVTGMPTPMTVSWQTPRVFSRLWVNGKVTDLANIDDYKAGFGYDSGPAQYSLMFEDPFTTPKRSLFLQLWVHTQAGCGDPSHPERTVHTRMALAEVDMVAGVHPLAVNRALDMTNLLCKINQPIELLYTDPAKKNPAVYRFTCAYGGSYSLANTIK